MTSHGKITNYSKPKKTQLENVNFKRGTYKKLPHVDDDNRYDYEYSILKEINIVQKNEVFH